MPRKSAAAAPPPPSPADDVANEPDLADFLKQLVNVDDVGVGDAGGDRFLHPRGAANADAVWSDLDNLDVADNIDGQRRGRERKRRARHPERSRGESQGLQLPRQRRRRTDRKRRQRRQRRARVERGERGEDVRAPRRDAPRVERSAPSGAAAARVGARSRRRGSHRGGDAAETRVDAGRHLGTPGRRVTRAAVRAEAAVEDRRRARDAADV